MAKELSEDTGVTVSIKTLGGIAALIATIVGMFSGDGAWIIGLIMIFVGGYLRYLSSQAVTVEGSVKEDRLDTNHYEFTGEKKLDNETYQLFLVEKYNIKKNDTLEKFVLDNKPYSNLSDALEVAHKIEAG